MKNYKGFEEIHIGFSDIAGLILAGFKRNEGLTLQELPFGTAGNYTAYIVDCEAEIGSHYKLVAEFDAWMRIYDDAGLVKRFFGEKIRVYRTGELGCVIQVDAT